VARARSIASRRWLDHHELRARSARIGAERLRHRTRVVTGVRVDLHAVAGDPLVNGLSGFRRSGADPCLQLADVAVDDSSLAVMSPRVISCRVSSVRACWARMRASAILPNFAVPFGTSALDFTGGEVNGSDDAGAHEHRDHTCGDQPDIELSVGALGHGRRARSDRDHCERQQREAHLRQRPDATLRVVDSGEIGGVDLLRTRKQFRLHQGRRLPQVRRPDREALHAVRSRGLDEPRVT
jgi:hypothetical protein